MHKIIVARLEKRIQMLNKISQPVCFIQQLLNYYAYVHRTYTYTLCVRKPTAIR
jgi:hypothetical protein